MNFKKYLGFPDIKDKEDLSSNKKKLFSPITVIKSICEKVSGLTTPTTSVSCGSGYEPWNTCTQDKCNVKSNSPDGEYIQGLIPKK